MNVLIVEDNATTLDATEVLLRAEGIDTQHAVSVDGAFLCLATERFDAVLLDLYLPGASGLAFLRALRQDYRYAALPVVVVTAAADAELEAVLREPGLGPVQLLRKPFDAPDLIAILRKLDPT
jgi:CheY-like chemotaxis protein